MSFLLIFAALPGTVRAGSIPLAPGEIVNVTIYGQPALSGERTLDENGKILLPLVGRVDAAGGTVEQLEDRVRTALKNAAVVEQPSVYIDVVKRRDVYVDGDVRTPGALKWHPGLTVEQAVALSGGLRKAMLDQFGTTLQAYGTIETYTTLERSIATLHAQQARLQAERDFVSLVFDGKAGEKTASEALNLAAFLPPQAAASPPADQAGQATRLLAGYTIAQFRQLLGAGGAFRPIRFPGDVAQAPGLAGMRATQQSMMADWIDSTLAEANSDKLQGQALAEKITKLGAQLDVLDGSIAETKAQLEKLQSLRDRGLARQSDYVALQTSYSSMLSSRIDLLISLGDTQVSLERQNLKLNNFAASTRSDVLGKLDSVQSQLATLYARRGGERRSAELAQGYVGDAVYQAEPDVTYAIGPSKQATATTVLAPGDTLIVSVAKVKVVTGEPAPAARAEVGQ
ncbi:polysaccharide biosynthesis/export family protein [Acidimangrovimonas pyrenivorans]|uniref:Polysaccharide biosynthesis/export family protein n=1 Tax=Acidimangrovimonas pyrenivorans TaxID=2030798 RepID=A0ABV7AH06_9RHOB